MVHITEPGKERDATCTVLEKVLSFGQLRVSSTGISGREGGRTLAPAEVYMNIFFCFKKREKRERGQEESTNQVLTRAFMLHFIGHQFLFVSHTIGEHILAFVQALDSVGFKMDAAGNVLDVLHVCPTGRRRGSLR